MPFTRRAVECEPLMHAVAVGIFQVEGRDDYTTSPE